MPHGFVWQVAVKGYQWKHRRQALTFPGGDTTTLTEGFDLEPLGKRYRPYRPMEEHTGLFRTFADIPATHDGIRAFAGVFGSLGTSAVHAAPQRDDQDASARTKLFEIFLTTVGYPVSFADWQAAILEMHTAVALWDRAQGGAAAPDALVELRDLVDRRLSSLRVRLGFRLGPGYGGNVLNPVLDVVPVTLLGALWVQLAQAIVAGKTFRACATCKRWFELNPKLHRTSRHFCSDGCRHRAYRTRKDQARRLSVEGKSVGEIADILGSDTEKVTAWLAAKKG